MFAGHSLPLGDPDRRPPLERAPLAEVERDEATLGDVQGERAVRKGRARLIASVRVRGRQAGEPAVAHGANLGADERRAGLGAGDAPADRRGQRVNSAERLGRRTTALAHVNLRGRADGGQQQRERCDPAAAALPRHG